MDPFFSFLQDYGVPLGLLAYVIWWLTSRFEKKQDQLINEIKQLRQDIKDVIVTCVTSCQNGTKANIIARDLQRNTK